MKLIKLIFLLSFFLSPLAHSQWWVSGGNLHWPYGDVTVSKGSVITDTVLSSDSDLFLKDKTRNSAIGLSPTHIEFSSDSNIFYGPVHFNSLNEIWLNNSTPFRIYNYDWADVFTYDYNNAKFLLKPYYNGSYFELDDRNVTTTIVSYITKINSGQVFIGDFTNGNSGTEIDLDDDTRKITLDADSVIVTGYINEGGVKEYVALVTWYETGAPDVDVIKNTLGAPISWNNVDDMGVILEASSPSNVFTLNKTSNFTTVDNKNDTNRIVIGKRVNDTVYSLESFNSVGNSYIIADFFQFLFKVSVYP